MVAAFMVAVTAFGQNFEPAKINPNDFNGKKVKVGGAFAIQLQEINQSAPMDTLLDLKHNFNLPTANLSITADLAPGIQVYINNYMSSRHHNEAWVEGGYLTIDNMPFLPAANKVMKYLTIRAGVMMPNYGDAHFYRSNNGDVEHNPFVGNWIMDAYADDPGLDVLYRNKGIIALFGVNNGRMNYGRGNDLGKDLVYNWKLGFDKNLTNDLRVRATVSGIHTPAGHSGVYLWDGDRAGARYYDVMVKNSGDDFRSGRWSPGSGQSKLNSYMANLFVKFHGLELFSIYEDMKGVKHGADQHFNQTALQAIYRMGSFYVGTRLNKVTDNEGSKTTRTNIGAGWNMVDNVLVKLDYVNQKYDGVAFNNYKGADINGGKFHGVVIEAALSF